MQDHRDRLIFWPLFCGGVIFVLMSKNPDGLLWPVTDGGLCAAFCFAVIHGADRNRPRSGLLRTGVILVGILNVGYGLWSGDLVDGIAFAVPLVIALGMFYGPSLARKVRQAR